MKVQQLIEACGYKVLNAIGDVEKEITGPYCCDLLSIAMGKLPAGAAWVTVMGNVNTIAVAELAEAAVVVMAEGVTMDMPALLKAKEHNVIVLATEQSIFATAQQIYQLLSE